MKSARRQRQQVEETVPGYNPWFFRRVTSLYRKRVMFNPVCLQLNQTWEFQMGEKVNNQHYKLSVKLPVKICKQTKCLKGAEQRKNPHSLTAVLMDQTKGPTRPAYCIQQQPAR